MFFQCVATHKRQWFHRKITTTLIEDRNREKSMMTGDLNAAEVEWIVQYRISDPRLYLFNVMDLRHAICLDAVCTVVGD